MGPGRDCEQLLFATWSESTCYPSEVCPMRPFVVVGMPRTGSTLLTTGIAQHPEAKCYGELFHPSDYERAHAHALQVNGEWIHFDPNREDAIEFLQNNVFCERDAATKAVGFKLLGDYVYGPGSEKLLLRMRKELPGLQVVHITRTKLPRRPSFTRNRQGHKPMGHFHGFVRGAQDGRAVLDR